MMYVAASINAATLGEQFDAAKAEYEQSSPRDEAARARYVTRLAQLVDQRVQAYWKTGERDAEYTSLAENMNAELKNNPLPKDSDSKRLTQLLIGKWQSPRHTYLFKANGKYGMEDGPMDTSWKLSGNQLIEGTSRGTIILLNAVLHLQRRR
jgi:hypothetical protein